MSNVTRHLRNRRPATIKTALREAGFPTVTAVAIRLGRSRSLVSQVISGDTKSLAIATAIAALIGRQPYEIWPRLYVATPETHPLAS